MPWVGLQCMIVFFLGQTHLLFDGQKDGSVTDGNLTHTSHPVTRRCLAFREHVI